MNQFISHAIYTLFCFALLPVCSGLIWLICTYSSGLLHWHWDIILGPGWGVLPMWWVIHMCRGFDPLFSLWQDRARSFWGIFLIHQQQSYLLGYKNYQFLQKSIFLAPNSIFSSIFLGPIFSGQRHTPISFQAEYPPGLRYDYWRASEVTLKVMDKILRYLATTKWKHVHISWEV